MSENSVKCGCKGFEFTRILCSHALKVLHTRKVRWSKDATFGLRLADCARCVPDVSMLSFSFEI